MANDFDGNVGLALTCLRVDFLVELLAFDVIAELWNTILNQTTLQLTV